MQLGHRRPIDLPFWHIYYRYQNAASVDLVVVVVGLGFDVVVAAAADGVAVVE